MKVYAKYHRASGAIIGRSVLPDEYDPGTGSADVGLIEADADPATQYVTAGALASRTDVAGLALDKTLIAADGVDAATVSGLPTGAWLRVGGAFVQAAPTHAITSASETTINAELVGAYRGPSLAVTAGSAVDLAFAADPRWQALQAATPAQIDAWLTSNVTTIAQARQVLRLLLLAVRRITRRHNDPGTTRQS